MTNMDCNKDEAVRLKDFAEKKIAENDAVGAKHFALKAKDLYPELNGLPQLIAVVDVHISADNKINGEVDWYGVLGVPPYADEDTIRKQYRKLALLLHPDKNKSAGADGAFKILSEAWNMLSDKERRFAYDQKRNMSTYTDVFLGKSSTATTSSNVYHDFFNNDYKPNSGQQSATYSKPDPHFSATATTSSNVFHDFLNVNNLNNGGQHGATYSKPAHVSATATMSSNGIHNFYNGNTSNNDGQHSATYFKPAPHVSSTETMSSNEFHDLYNGNNSNNDGQHSATYSKPAHHVSETATATTSSNGFDNFCNPNNGGQHSAMYSKPAPDPSVTATATTSSNGFENFNNRNTPNNGGQHSAMYSKPAPDPSAGTDTFWTICSACKMHFEYSRAFVNQHLPCVNCRTAFYSVETSAPSIKDSKKYTSLSDFVQQRKSRQVRTAGLGRFPSSSSSTKNFQEGTAPGSESNINMAPPASFTAQAAGVTHSASKTRKRRRKESQTGTGTEESPQIGISSQKTHAGLGTGSSGLVSSSSAKEHRPKKRRIGATAMGNHMEVEDEGVSLSSFQKNDFEKGRTNVAGISSNSIKPPQQGICDILTDMARNEIRKKINPCKSPSLSNGLYKPKVSDEEMDKKDEGNGKDVPSKKPDAHKSAEFVDIKSSIQPKLSPAADSDVDPTTATPELMSMSVPDSDFHDFDQDRTEKSFGENQVWAAYDDDDGMPRYYAMIHSVVSLKPFKMRMSWLNSKSNAELGPMNWIGSGFYKTSGEFRIGKHEVNQSLNSFSHKVKWSKGRKGTIQIYPRKGDVWALYRNWSSDWNALTPDDVIHKYDMVEVLEDYNEQSGVAVAPLVKVPDLKTVFRKHCESSKTWVIPREQLFRFSHQVPSYLLTGQEGQKSCKGCFELDPAATPLELLQVFTEAQVKEMESVIERAGEEASSVMDSKRSKGKELAENDQEKKPKVTGKGVGQAVMEEEIKKEKVNNGMLVYSRRQPKPAE